MAVQIADYQSYYVEASVLTTKSGTTKVRWITDLKVSSKVFSGHYYHLAPNIQHT